MYHSTKSDNTNAIPDTTITVRINSAVKASAQATFRELGLDLSTAINIFLRQVIHNRCLPFPVALTPNSTTPTPATNNTTTVANANSPTTQIAETKKDSEELSGAARLLDNGEDVPLGQPFSINPRH